MQSLMFWEIHIADTVSNKHIWIACITNGGPKVYIDQLPYQYKCTVNRFGVYTILSTFYNTDELWALI